MKRSAFLAVPFAIGAVSMSLDSLAYKDNPSDTLSAGSIAFHVLDDDKDHDSYETIAVSCSGHLAGDVQSAGAGTVWKDQSDPTPIPLNNIDSGIEKSDCEKIHVSINHATKGNDNFKFSFSVTLNFGKTRYVYNSGGITLSKNSGHYEGDLTKS